MSNEESKRSIETLRALWCRDVSEALWENIGGFDRIQQAQILFNIVRELQKRGVTENTALAVKEICKGIVRGLWGAPESSCSSLRSEPGQQQSGELTDTLQVVSQLSPRHSQKTWQIGSWEDGISRVANGVPSRVDRLKGLGNAVVPQIPEMIGRAIIAAHNAPPA